MRPACGLAENYMAKRISWFDDKSEMPLIEQRARQLDSFVQTMADGKVDATEIKAQEGRLVALMKEIEPKLDDALHDKVGQLLCELTAYDLMQILYTVQQARPKTKFRG
jgi:hypothetical protein